MDEVGRSHGDTYCSAVTSGTAVLVAPPAWQEAPEATSHSHPSPSQGWQALPHPAPLQIPG